VGSLRHSGDRLCLPEAEAQGVASLQGLTDAGDPIGSRVAGSIMGLRQGGLTLFVRTRDCTVQYRVSPGLCRMSQKVIIRFAQGGCCAVLVPSTVRGTSSTPPYGQEWVQNLTLGLGRLFCRNVL
jgi:hypothetical protein